MTRWFRFYDDALNDPKILKLSDKSYRIWTQLLCAASKNDGALPLFEDLIIMLRMKAEKLQPELEKLITAGLIDHDDAGMSPHNWNGRQFKSDVSTDRVKRFRNGKRNVSVTPPETEQIQTQRTERKKEDKTADAVSILKAYVFEGDIVKLKKKHFDDWTVAFPNLDLRAELTARDVWLASERATDADRQNWFVSTSKYLANENGKVKNNIDRPRRESAEDANYRGIL